MRRESLLDPKENFTWIFGRDGYQPVNFSGNGNEVEWVPQHAIPHQFATVDLDRGPEYFVNLKFSLVEKRGFETTRFIYLGAMISRYISYLNTSGIFLSRELIIKWHSFSQSEHVLSRWSMAMHDFGPLFSPSKISSISHHSFLPRMRSLFQWSLRRPSWSISPLDDPIIPMMVHWSLKPFMITNTRWP